MAINQFKINYLHLGNVNIHTFHVPRSTSTVNFNGTRNDLYLFRNPSCVILFWLLNFPLSISLIFSLSRFSLALECSLIPFPFNVPLNFFASQLPVLYCLIALFSPSTLPLSALTRKCSLIPFPSPQLFVICQKTHARK